MKHAEPDFLQGYKAIYQPFKIDKRCIECQKELRTEITKLKVELTESIPKSKVQGIVIKHTGSYTIIREAILKELLSEQKGEKQ